MKIVFFGTPDYVLPVLTKVHKTFVTGPGKSPIAAVVTQAPKPTGRKQILTYSPVDKWAHEHKIPIYYKASDLISDNIEAELAILESYGNILKKEEINYFPKGIINIHPSLLPRWRGASPVPATLIAGDNVAGGTVIKLDEQVDHGPIISYFREEITSGDTTDSLRRRIFQKSADVMAELLPAYLSGKVQLKPQNDTDATFTTRITKEEAFIDLDTLIMALSGKSSRKTREIPFMAGYKLKSTPNNIYNFIRAMFPWPIAWTKLDNGQRLKLLKAHLENDELILDEVQLEGKNPVSYQQFKEAYSNLILD